MTRRDASHHICTALLYCVTKQKRKKTNKKRRIDNFAMFEQSKQMRHATCDSWIRSVYGFLESRPIDAIYSVAFSVAFGVPFKQRDAFLASSELFDLLDDLLRDTSELTSDEIVVSHCATYDEFKQSVETFDSSIEPFASVMKMYNRRLRNEDATEHIVNETVQTDAMFVATKLTEGSKLVRVPLNRACSDSTSFATTYDYVLTDKSVDAAVTTSSFRLANTPNSSRSALQSSIVDATSRAKATNPASASSSFSISTRDVDVDASLTVNPFEMYSMYAWSVHWFAATRNIRDEIHAVRNVTVEPIYLPRGSAWQHGASQLLWILLHTIAALCVVRSNVFVKRFLTLLENLSFFIWCGTCAMHWEKYGGKDYFARLSQLPDELRNNCCVDAALILRHNEVSINSILSRPVNGTVVNKLILEYRSFANALLRRSNADDDDYSLAATTPRDNVHSLTRDEIAWFKIVRADVYRVNGGNAVNAVESSRAPYPVGLY